MTRKSCLLVLALSLLLPAGLLAGDVTVKAAGFRDTKGMAIVYLWNAADGFPMKTEKALTNQSTKIEGNSITVVFKDVKPGDYAVSITHDANENQKMDTGFMGKPKEGYGVSNNPKTTLRAPRFDEGKITVGDEGKTVEITMKY